MELVSLHLLGKLMKYRILIFSLKMISELEN